MSTDKPQSVLIIGVETATGARIASALRDAGFEARIAAATGEGVQSMLDRIPSLMIIDVAPRDGYDGYEVLREIQDEPLLAMMPVFLISTAAAPIDMSRVRRNSAIEFFWAPTIDAVSIAAKAREKLGSGPAVRAETPQAPEARRKLLWVEDDRLIGTILSKKLTSSGFDLYHAKNGEEAMEVLRSMVPDIIVLDLVLPNMSGFDILQLIRQDQQTQGIPVMILSNLSKQSDIERAKALGARKFLVKAATSLDQIVEEIRSLR